jgi:hypothetical protein
MSSGRIAVTFVLIDFAFMCRAEQTGAKDSYRWLTAQMIVVQPLNDPELFEQVARDAGQMDKFADKIAKAYLAARRPEAVVRLLTPEESDGSKGVMYPQDELLLAAYRQLGDDAKIADYAWRIFRNRRSEGSLKTLLDIVGLDLRDQIIAGEIDTISQNAQMDGEDTAFLLEYATTDDLERYLVTHVRDFPGMSYGTLKPLAETMESRERPSGCLEILSPRS